jgi:hypothetical protein
MNKPPSILTLIAFIAALAIFGFYGAKTMLGRHSASTNDQLALVWPDIASMPAPERNFLVELALTCNVVARDPVRAEVVDCLQDTARKLPPGASERLDRLVRQAR